MKETYGVDIKMTHEGTQQPSIYMTKVKVAIQANEPAPYDVMNIEENYAAEALAEDMAVAYLPSPLIPNEGLVIDHLKTLPYTVALQASTHPCLLVNKNNAGWMTTLKELADPRLKGKIVWPPPGDITNNALFLGLAAELGKDYKNADQMKEVVDWFMANVHPNVLKYTSDSSEMSTLLHSGAVDVAGYWNSQSRLEYFGGHTEIGEVFPPFAYTINGYLWIPKNAPHPLLAQIYINWRLSPEVQFPNDWPISHAAWAEMSEGFLGPSYEQYIPDWFKADYYKFYPTMKQIENMPKIDWAANNPSAKIWQDYFAQQLGM